MSKYTKTETTLTKDQLREWKKKLKEGAFFMAGLEVKKQRKATFINICRFADGSLPSDKHMMHQGHLAGQLFFMEFMKCCDDTCLKGAPDEVIDDLAGGGKLYKFVSDLFVHAYWRMEFNTISKTIKNWDQWKGVLDSVKTSQQVEKVEDDEGQVVE